MAHLATLIVARATLPHGEDYDGQADQQVHPIISVKVLVIYCSLVHLYKYIEADQRAINTSVILSSS